jgi:membrane-associated protein
MKFLDSILDFFLRLNEVLEGWASDLGAWMYVILFIIVFCETGLVVTPFLPGDSLLFAVGALAARPQFHIDVYVVGVVMSVAAILGDAVNYAIGYRLGPRVFAREDSRLLNRAHLVRTQRFYEKHGGKTIILARFVPIIRTFAPFVAGVGKMRYSRFAAFNIVGGLLWVWSILLVGYIFGNVPAVKERFTLVILGIIVVSVLPVAFEILRARAESRAAKAAALAKEDVPVSPPRE